MKLTVYVCGQAVATLDQLGDFESVLSYYPEIASHQMVSLTMPVRTKSYVWKGALPPFFQMNLPEGYLLQVLQEQLGPVVGGDPTTLLSVVGRAMVGRVQVAGPGANLTETVRPLEIARVLHGDNSEQLFARLVHEYATSGVSGVVPKFLDAQHAQSARRGQIKGSLITRRHIVKGSTRFPYLALNEHLCMQVVRAVMPAARTTVSDDGHALVVDRFDLDDQGERHWAIEDFCALLGLRPEAKYDTTWERIAKAVRDLVPGEHQRETMLGLTKLLLLTYALRNADCHSKNIALRYTNPNDPHLAPAYDMVTTVAYPGFEQSPPGLSFLGKRTWTPGKNLERFVVATLGIQAKDQRRIVEEIGDAMTRVNTELVQASDRWPAFRETAKRMALAWGDGIAGLRSRRVFALTPNLTTHVDELKFGQDFSPPIHPGESGTTASPGTSRLKGDGEG